MGFYRDGGGKGKKRGRNAQLPGGKKKRIKVIICSPKRKRSKRGITWEKEREEVRIPVLQIFT